MSYKLIKKLDNGVRIGELSTPHGKIETPFFMPVGTAGSVKGVSPDELRALGAQIVLSNTYHLYLRPGEKLIKNLGGLHCFMNWDRPILTDSGGYQVFSLAKNNFQLPISNNQKNTNSAKSKHNQVKSLVKISEEGVEFTSHLDGSKHLFTPEKVIQIQLDLGVDVLMPLDVCPSGKATKREVEEACELTTAWAKRAKTYFDKQVLSIKYQVSSDRKVVPVCKTGRPNLIRNLGLKVESDRKVILSESKDLSTRLKTNANTTNSSIIVKCKPACPAGGLKNENYSRPLLHGIVQGGLYPDLRKKHAKEITSLDFDGYSVGGLAVDNETRDMWKVVKLMGEILPEDKQRYLMGVGTPDDLIRATKLGMDMFDCVLPTRLGRHGSVFLRKTSNNNQVTIRSANRRTHGLTAITKKFELVNLLNSRYREDGGVIDPDCGCFACNGGYSRAYISHLVRSKEMLGLRLATLHNLYTYLQLMESLRRGKI